MAWLKSELYRMRPNLTSEEVKIIEEPDLANVEQNKKREDILLHRYGRSAIIDKLPTQMDWFEVKIERADAEKFFILPVWDWFLDTGKTFKLEDIPISLSSRRGHKLPNYSQEAITHHYRKVTEMLLSPGSNLGELIMISSTKSGPFTIIDGTHSSATLLKNGKLQGTKGFLGIADDLSQCIWSIERADLGIHIATLNQWADQGIIW